MSFANLLATRSLVNEFREQGLVIQDRVRNFLRNEVVTTQLGYGSYRVYSDNPIHRESLLVALQSGINLIDTSSNFTYGESEKMIGMVLSEIKGKSSRDHFILISKAGYIQGPAMDEIIEMEKQGQFFQEMLKMDSVCWYCIHPEFIRYQFFESLKRLGVEQLDVYLIQNPEYFFISTRKDGVECGEARIELYRRIQEAFTALEQLVNEGYIKYYGISSNTLGYLPAAYDFINLNEIIECAIKAGQKVNGNKANHHFQVIQMPANLIEHQLISVVNNQSDNELYSVLERANQLNLDVLLNRPLSTRYEEGFLQFTRKKFDSERDYKQDLQNIFNSLSEIESQIMNKILSIPSLEHKLRSIQEDQFKLFEIGRELTNLWPMIEDKDHLKALVDRYLMPHTQRSVESLMEYSDSYPGEVINDIDLYLSHFAEFENLGEEALNKRMFCEKLTPALDGLENLFLDESSCWVKASLSFLADLPGKPIILNGMRSKGYVQSSGEFLIEDRKDYRERLKALCERF
ncbi:MAG: aldo/keto reductase [bacterium]|nr:aldo/keto reductase [bacterium]